MKALGGQAILEGVMIKAPDKVSMAARLPNGKIAVVKRHHPSLTQRWRVLSVPFVRGIILLVEMMIVGIEAITWSANQQGEEESLGAGEWVLTIIDFVPAFSGCAGRKRPPGRRPLFPYCVCQNK